MPEPTVVIRSGFVRGHDTAWSYERQAHVFVATGELAPASGGDEPACPFCGLHAERNGPDPCLGEMVAVGSACCGHGVHEGWIRFDGGPTLAVRVDYPGCWTPGEPTPARLGFVDESQSVGEHG